MQETRAHRGVETQRQWSDNAIARTTRCLPAPLSIVTLLAARLPARERKAAQAAWYPKTQPTFSEALASLRRALRREPALATSHRRRGTTKPRFPLPPPWAYALCNAASVDKVELGACAATPVPLEPISWVAGAGRAWSSCGKRASLSDTFPGITP